LKKYPDDPQVYLEYAASLLVAGKLEESQDQLDRATSKGVKAAGDVAALRGLLAMAQRDYAAAEQQFTLLLEERPGDFHALRRLPIVLAAQQEQGKLVRAVQLATIQAKKMPQSPEAQATLAWVVLHQGKPDEARQALVRSPPGTDPETLYLMARTFVELGEIDAAKPSVASLRSQLKRSGWFPQRADAEEWVKTIALSLE
jgi:predicted Zn-dependent protease